jgi:hypothetical protein
MKKRTSVRGKALLKATTLKTFDTINFFLILVMARTQSSISTSCNSSGEIRVESRRSLLVPHAVGSCSERLDPVLSEGLNELDA